MLVGKLEIGSIVWYDVGTCGGSQIWYRGLKGIRETVLRRQEKFFSSFLRMKFLEVTCVE